MQKGRLWFNDTIFTDIKYECSLSTYFSLSTRKKITSCESAVSYWKVVGIAHFDLQMPVSSIHIIIEVFVSEMLSINRHAQKFKIFYNWLSEVISIDIDTC